MREKDQKVCRDLYFFEYFIMFVSAVTGCASVSAFASLVDAHAGTASYSVGLKIYALTSGIKKY